MLGKIGLVIAMGIILGGCGINRRAGIEIMSYPPSSVWIDGKETGMTPYKNSYLKPGLVEIKLKNNKGDEWSKKIELTNNINTVVDWEMGEEGGGYILSMERTGDTKRAGIIVNTSPSEAAVAIDGEIKGFSPVKIEDISEGDRQVTLSYPTYKSLNIFARAVAGYRLLVEASLVKELMIEPTVMPTVVPTEQEIMIKPTETGWLRVRETASNAARELGRVLPGQKYKLLGEQEGWYRIESGWISAKYAEKL